MGVKCTRIGQDSNHHRSKFYFSSMFHMDLRIQSAFLPGIDDVTEVWRQGAVVGHPRRLRVGVRLREVVGQLPRPGEHLSTLIRSIDHFNLNGTRTDTMVGDPCSRVPDARIHCDLINWAVSKCKL